MAPRAEGWLLFINRQAAAKKLIDRLSTKAEVEDGKSVTNSAQPNCPS
jgi:hypothetical protein